MRYLFGLLLACALVLASAHFGWLDHDSPNMALFVVTVITAVLLWATVQPWGAELRFSVFMWCWALSIAAAFIIGARNWSPLMHDIGVEIAAVMFALMATLWVFPRSSKKLATS